MDFRKLFEIILIEHTADTTWYHIDQHKDILHTTYFTYNHLHAKMNNCCARNAWTCTETFEYMDNV